MIVVCNSNCITHSSRKQLFQSSADQMCNALKDFNPDMQENLSGRALEKLSKRVRDTDYKNADCFVCVILACGGITEVGSINRSVIYGSDTIFYSLDLLFEQVSQNRSLLGKPKIYFMLLNKCSKKELKAAGREKSPVEGVVDAGGKKFWRSEHADSFIYYVVLEKETGK